MHYEKFLFTRNQRRDFTAFVRPGDLSNKEISTLASALGYVNDVSQLTPQWPALYGLPLGDYIMLLRHFDSGRTHAGRNIGIVEGIAVKRTRARHFALALPYFLAHQDELLTVAAEIPDLDSMVMGIPSGEHEWPDIQGETVTEGKPDKKLVDEFVARLATDRLIVPFNDDGYAMLMAVLSDQRFPSLYFAFGTNSDVIARLNQSHIEVDVVSYFNTTAPSFRSRATNEITSEITGYRSYRPVERSVRPAPPAQPPADETPVETPSLRVTTPPENIKDQPHDDALEQLSGDGALTPREMARRLREQETPPEAELHHEPGGLLGWFGGLLARLLGRK